MVARGCHVSSQDVHLGAAGAHYREARSVGFPGNRQPPLLARGCAPPLSPPHLATRALRTTHFNQRCPPPPPPPSLSFPLWASLLLQGAGGRSWGGSRGRSPCIPSLCCVTLESCPALSGRERHKWKCEANQTRCDYFGAPRSL